MKLIICAGVGSMSDKEGEKDNDNESLSDWTLVNQDETLQNEQEEELEESTEGAIGPPKEGEEEESDDEEEEEEEEGDEELEVAVVKTGSKVEEIKADADAESLSSSESPEERVRKRRSRKPEATQDEETDLSLASSPSLPDDLPAIRPEPQYVHTPDQQLNSRLNLIVALTLACVIGLGIGHFLGVIDLSSGSQPGWSSRTMWEENLNAAQIVTNLDVENEDLQSQILALQASNRDPIKITGKDGKEARELREKITQLISDNEDMRLAIARVQYISLPDADRAAFNRVVQENHHLRTSVAKLMHLGPDLEKLRASIELLELQNKELVSNVAKIRYEQPMPRELKSIVKEMESVKLAVVAEMHKKKPSSNVHSAKGYLVFMSQILSAFNSLNDDEVGLVEKVDLARDVFTLVVPKGVKIPPSAQAKVELGRSKFKEIRESLQTKWKQLKELTKPENIAEIGQSTLSKMNRVIVNVVNKIKDIAHMTILKQKTKPVDLVVSTLADKITVLDEQFDKTWRSLQAEVPLPIAEKEEIFGPDYDDEPIDVLKDDNDINNDDDDEDDDNILLAGPVGEKERKENYNKPQTANEEKPKDFEFKKHMLMKEEEKKKTEEIKEKERSEKEKESLRKKTKKAIKEEISKNSKSVKKEEMKKEPPIEKKSETPAVGTHKMKPATKDNKKKGAIKDNKKKDSMKDNKKKDAIKDDKKLATKVKTSRKEENHEETPPGRTKFHVKELHKANEPEPSARYFKGQYNKFDKLNVPSEEEATDKKYFKRKEDDDDEEDEDIVDTHHKSHHSKRDKDGSGGLKRLWEKPLNKKSSAIESNGTKNLFIKRRG